MKNTGNISSTFSYKKYNATQRTNMMETSAIFGIRNYDSKDSLNWNKEGIKLLQEVFDNNYEPDINLSNCLSKGMKNFMDEVGYEIVGKKPYFIHENINDYYKLEEKVLGKEIGSKANTADVIISSHDIDDTFNSLQTGKVKIVKDCVIFNDKVRILQVSLKKDKHECLLGKVSNKLKEMGYYNSIQDEIKTLYNEKDLKECVYKNFNKILDEINKKLDWLVDLSRNDNKVKVTNFEFIKVDKIDRKTIFYLVGNYLTMLICEKILTQKNINKIIRQISAEMLFGNTKLPLYKVYGYFNNNKTYEFLGDKKSYIEKEFECNSDIFGLDIQNNSQYYTMKYYIMDKIENEKKYYTVFRTGTKSSSSFSFLIEGKHYKGPYELKESLSNIM